MERNVGSQGFLTDKRMVAVKAQMSNNFLHLRQITDSIEEELKRQCKNLWNNRPISGFLRMSKRSLP